MKTISLDIPENLYKPFKSLLKLLPDKIKVYEEDVDTLTAEEEAEVYQLKDKISKQDLSDFDEWDDVKKKL